MKLALFDDWRPGVISADGGIVDVSARVGDEVMALPGKDRIPAIISAFDLLGDELRAATDQPGQPLDAVRLRPPLPRPGKLLCAQGNYKEEVDTELKPIQLFLKASSSVIGPGDTIELPPWQASIFHHEAELALVIGAAAKGVSPAEARDHIFGYTCLLDVSARGALQRVGFGDKSLDTFGPLGPWIVTADEVPDPQDLGVRLWVDGEPRHDYRTDDMEHPVGELVAWAAQIATLEPGDVIACGVNHQGVGPLQDGETVKVEIERIGRMELRVSDPLRRTWPKGIDTEVAEFVRGKRLDPSLPALAKLAVRTS